MASTFSAGACAIIATAFWTLVGFSISRLTLPRAIAAGSAPIVGWAVHNAVALPVLMIVGFSPASVIIVASLSILAGVMALFWCRTKSEKPEIDIPLWAYFHAAALAFTVAAAIMPKISAESVQLAAPIFDHSKIAIIDAIARLGLPPVNPFFGEGGEPGRLVYYYLWYFSAAEVSSALGVSGWEADIALTWFAAFSSLTLMMGLATWISRNSCAGLWVAFLTCGTSLRDFLATVFGGNSVNAVLAPSTGFAGWLFQAAWVPQHMASASCVVVAMVFIGHFAYRRTCLRLATLVLLITAGFECSTYVGGVTFAVAALIAVPILCYCTDAVDRRRFFWGMSVAAVIAICLVAPFILDQIGTIGKRGVGTPVYVDQFDVLSEAISPTVRRLLDLPAYWLILLPIEFPAVYVAGALALIALLRSNLPDDQRATIIACAILALTGLAISWLLVVDLGGNNDLRMRAVLPSAMILTAAAAAAIVRPPRKVAIVAAAIAGLVLSLPHTFGMIRYNFNGDATTDGKVFFRSPELWAAVRRHVGADQRVGNNPLFLKNMTTWPANISWSLLANRSSCFAADELVLAYVAMPRARREAILAQFIRVFEGTGTSEDVSDLAIRYDCNAIVVTAEDKAWQADPFSTSPLYTLAETKKGEWRIYIK